MSHDSHQEFLILLLLSRGWENFDACSDLFNEAFNISDLSGGVVKKETCVSIDPLANGVLELLNEWSRIDSEPSNVY